MDRGVEIMECDFNRGHSPEKKDMKKLHWNRKGTSTMYNKPIGIIRR